MNNEKKVYRIEPNGPAGSGLVKMDLDAADFQSELPEQRLHVYYQEGDLSVGVWTTTDMQEAFGPYPGDEFMWVLEGQVDMLDGDNNATHVNEGQSFLVPNGIPTSWKQVGSLRKIYMTHSNGAVSAPDAPVQVLDPASMFAGLVKMDVTDPFEIKGDLPVQHDNAIFTSASGNMIVGMWDSTPFESEMLPFPCNEFVQLLEGSVTITEENGTAHTFKAGDAYFIPTGTVCSWKATEYMKKYYSIVL